MLRESPEVLREGLRRRGALEALTPVLDRAADLERQRRTLIQSVEERKANRNRVTQEVARLRRAGQNADELMRESRDAGTEIARMESELQDVEARLRGILLELPNINLPEVPEGGEENNSIVRDWGEPRISDGCRPHFEIGPALGILDFERGAKITGSGFIVFRSRGARLVRALMNLMLDVHTQRHGYEEVWVPFVVNRASLTGTGNLPKFEVDLYGLKDDDLFLIPTAEVPVTNLHRDEILNHSALPVSMVSFTPCFRREAGAHGKDTRGLLRVHEFDKVELVRLCAEEDSPSQLELLLSHAEEILRILEIPYRVKLLAAGDTGFSSAKTYDLEAWAPGVGAWLEVSSCSSFTDFQARRSNMRYRPADGGKPKLVHTLNGSALAFARTIACILEHHQEDGKRVRLPEALRGYFGADYLDA
jgi:seryl-tRNA synthetase